MTNEVETINQEIQTVMSRSRVLLEEMTVLLHWHSPEVNRRQHRERRSGQDRRLCSDRRAEPRRSHANLYMAQEIMSLERNTEVQTLPINSCHHQDGRRNLDGRRQAGRRQAHEDRRSPLPARQESIETQMRCLAARNILLQQRLASLNAH